MEMHLYERRNNTVVRRPYQIVFLDHLIIPEEDIGTYVEERQRKAASIIQKTWRGHIIRKRFSTTRTKLTRQNAALKIQRFYRNWQYLKKITYKQPAYLQPLDRILEEDLPVFQKYMKKWQDDHQFEFDGFECITKRHHEVEDKVNQFYYQAHTSKSRHQQINEKICQLQMQSLILQESPSLKDSTTALENMDTAIFNCPPLSDAKQARINHRQQLKLLNRPWWKQLLTLNTEESSE